MRAPESYRAPPGLGNAHVQTIVSSLGRKRLLPAREAEFVAAAEERCCSIDGVKLLVHANLRQSAPLVVVIPGWLGSSTSSYVISAAKALWNHGFSVCRINLRDHGETAHLNEGLFNSALIDEVVGLVRHLCERHAAQRAGVLGYSLGGNFALRVARRVPELATLAVCPALSPEETMWTIERNFIYQRYFVRKWRQVFATKEAAYPERYDFGPVMGLSTISAMTDYFVDRHTEFDHTDDYFSAYDLTGAALAGVRARVLAAADDPIIPARHYADLPASVELDLLKQGGHGAFLENWRLDSWADRYAVDFFQQKL